jgi:hypothetical protein
MVEGVPVCGMAWSFAGPRENVNLGRSVGWQRVSSPAGSRTDDTGRPEAAEEGNAVRMRASPRMHRTRDARTISRSGCRHVLRSVLGHEQVSRHE